MDTATRELLLEIARCPIANDIVCNNDHTSSCVGIVRSQEDKSGILERDRFQAPTPWIGHLEVAPILFLSSNPSINDQEEAALSWSENWQADRIVDYFDNLFSDEWTDKKRLRMRKKPEYQLEDEYGKRNEWVRFWASVRRRACELLERPIETVRPGWDYALIEAVRCKSKHEIGVKDAASTCLNRYLIRTLTQA